MSAPSMHHQYVLDGRQRRRLGKQRQQQQLQQQQQRIQELEQQLQTLQTQCGLLSDLLGQQFTAGHAPPAHFDSSGLGHASPLHLTTAGQASPVFFDMFDDADS
eukprot:12424247-Karenia_brevis.AAC.1